MDDLERKKWIISRADITFNLHRQMIKEKENEVEHFRESEVNRWKKFQTGIVSTAVTSIGIIVGLHEIYPNMINYGVPILMISAIALLMYLPTVVFRYVNEKIFDDMVSSNTATNSWHHSYGCFLRYATEIEQHSYNDFQKFLEYFTRFVTISEELSLYISLKRHSSWWKLLFLSVPAVKKMIASKKQIQRLLDVTSTTYVNTRNEYESIQMIKDLLIYGNALLRYNNGIIIIPQRRIISSIKNIETT